MDTRITRVLVLCLSIVCTSFSAYAQAKTSEQVVEIPFEFVRNEIIVQVKVNGKGPFNMMIDTGTDPSAVDLATAKDLGLKLDSVGHKGSGGGTDVNLAYVTKLPVVELGGLSVKNLAAVGINLSKVTERFGKPLHGVLGHSLLNGRIVQIDYPNRVLRFYSQSPFAKVTNQPNTQKRTVMRFRYSDNVLLDDVLVNGKKLVGNLDTGSNGNFALTPAAIAYLGLEEEVSRAPVSTDVGYNGVAENRQGTVKTVTVGGISVDGPTVSFIGKGMGRDKAPWGVNIGNVFLKEFVVTIDYRTKLVTLER